LGQVWSFAPQKAILVRKAGSLCLNLRPVLCADLAPFVDLIEPEIGLRFSENLMTPKWQSTLDLADIVRCQFG
jgi:hypothetical protein